MPSSARPVDEVIAKLTLESGEFQRSAYEAIGTFNKLKTELSSNIKDNLNSVAAGIDKIASRFDFLGSLQTRFMWRLSDSIIDMGQNLFRTATSAIRDGWGEYNTKMNSVMTMKANGYAIEDITASLKELNSYADKTIYSLADMTSAMSQFTTKGVDLKTATAAVMGMSNAAGLNNATNADLKSALYNLSQALSAGYMSSVDWRTMDTRNISSIGMKKDFVETAQALGTLEKQADGTYKTLEGHLYSFEELFKDALKDRWMNKDVLLKTMEHFADESTAVGKAAYEATTSVKTFHQMTDTIKEDIGSGWSETFEILVGNLDEATVLFTGIKDEVASITGPISTFRNEMLGLWKEFGGRTFVLQGLKNLYEAVKSVATAIVSAFNDVFRPDTRGSAKFLTEASKGFKDFTWAIKVAAETISTLLGPALRIIFTMVKLILAPLGLIHTAFKELSKAVNLFAKPLALINDLIQMILDPFNRLISAVANFDLSGIKNAFQGIKDLFNPWKELTSHLDDSWHRLGRSTENGGTGEQWRNQLGILLHDKGKIAEWFDQFGKQLENSIRKAFEYMINIPDSFLSQIGSVGLKVFDTFAELVKGSGGVIFDGLYDILGALFDIVKVVGGALFKALKSVYNFIKGIIKWVASFTAGTSINILKAIANALRFVADALQFAFDIAGRAFGWLKVTATNVLNTFSKKLEGLWNTLRSFGKATGFTNAFKKLAEYLKLAGAALKGGNLFDLLFNPSSIDKKSMSMLGIGDGNLLTSILGVGGSAISSGFEAIKKFIFSLLPDNVTSELDAFGTALYNAVSPTIQGAWNFMVEIVTDFKTAMDNAKKSLDDFLGKHETLKKIFDTISNALTEIWNHVTKYYDAFKEGGFSGMFSSMGDDIKSAFDSMQKFFDSVPTDGNSVFSDLAVGAQAFASISWDSIREAVEGIVKSITSPEAKEMVDLLMKLTGMYAAVKISAKLGGLLDALRDLAKMQDPLGSIESFGTKLVTFSKTFSGRIVALSLLAFGLSALAKGFVVLAEVPWQRLATAAGVMVAVFAALGIIAAKLGDNAKNLFALGMMGASLFLVAAGIALICGAVKLMNMDDIYELVDVMIVFGIFFGFMTWLSTHLQGGQMLMAAASILVFSVGVAVLVGSIVLVFSLLKSLEVMDETTLWMAVGVVVALAAGVFIIGKLLSKASQELNKSNFGWTMLGIAALFMSLTHVINTIGSSGILNDSWSVQSTMWVLVVMFGGVIALIVVIGAVAKILQSTDPASSLRSMAMVFAAIGITFLLLAASIQTIMSIPDLSAAISTMWKLVGVIAVMTLIGIVASFAKGSAESVLMLAAGIALLAGSLMLLSGLDVASLEMGLGALLAVITVLFVAAALVWICTPIAGGLMILTGALTSLAIAAGVGLLIAIAITAIFVAISKAGEGLTTEELVQKLENFCQEIVAYGPRVGNAVGEAIGGMLAAIVIGLVRAIWTFIKTLFSAAGKLFSGGAEELETEGKASVGKAFSSIGEKIKSSISDMVSGVINTVTHPLTSIKNWLFGGDDSGSTQAAEEKAAAPFKAAKSVTETESAELQATTDEAVGKIDDSWSIESLTNMSSYSEVFDGNITDLVNSAGKLDDVTSSVTNFQNMDWTAGMQQQSVDVNSMVNITGAEDLGSNVSQNVVSSLAGGLAGGSQVIQGGIDVLTAAADEEWKQFDWKSVGANCADGLAAGLESSGAMQKVRSAARALAQAAVDEANATVQSHSPSRVFMRIGGYIWQGFVQGISNGIDRVKSATFVLAQAAVDTAQSAMDSMSMRPTVTPVLDISNLEKIPGVGTGVEIPIRADIRGLGADIDGMTNRIVNSNKSVTTKINELIDKLESVELRIALQPQELDGNVITDTVEEITSIRKLLSDFGKGEA